MRQPCPQCAAGRGSCAGSQGKDTSNHNGKREMQRSVRPHISHPLGRGTGPVPPTSRRAQGKQQLRDSLYHLPSACCHTGDHCHFLGRGRTGDTPEKHRVSTYIYIYISYVLSLRLQNSDFTKCVNGSLLQGSRASAIYLNPPALSSPSLTGRRSRGGKEIGDDSIKIRFII